MTSPRARASHVRPRPPSTGRPSKPTRAVRPETQRVRQHRGLDARRRRLPLPTRLLLALSVLALGGAVFLTPPRGPRPILSKPRGTLPNPPRKLPPTALPRGTIIAPPHSPVLRPPQAAHTNHAP